MTTTKIPQLAPLTTALDGTEEFELARNSVSRRITSVNLFKTAGILPSTGGNPSPASDYRIPLFKVSDGLPYSCTLAQALTLQGDLPAGGTTGQVLAKASDADYDTVWTSDAGGTVTSVNASGGTTGLSFSGGPITTSGTLTVGGTLTVANGGTGRASLTDHGLLVGAGTSAVTQLAAASAGTLLTGQGASSDPSFSATPTLGISGTTKGTLALAGNTSGAVTVQPAAAAGTWSLTLPTSAGTSGYFLQTDGSGVTSWATAVASAGANELLYSSGGAITGISGSAYNSGTLNTTFPGTVTTFALPGSVFYHDASLNPDNGGYNYKLRYSGTERTDGPPVDPVYTDDVWAWGINIGSAEGTKANPLLAYGAWHLESKFWQPGQTSPFLEHFFTFIPANSTTNYRPIAFVGTHDGSYTNAGFNAHQITFQTLDAQPRVEFDYRAGQNRIGIYNSLSLQYSVNNVPIASQANASGSSSVNLPYINDNNRYAFATGFEAAGGGTIEASAGVGSTNTAPLSIVAPTSAASTLTLSCATTQSASASIPVTTNGTTTITAASGAVTKADVGRLFTGAGVSGSPIVATYVNATTFTASIAQSGVTDIVLSARTARTALFAVDSSGAVILRNQTSTGTTYHDNGSGGIVFRNASFATIMTLSNTGAIAQTSTDSSALAVGPSGITNPTFRVNASTASAATGIVVTGAAAGSRAALAAISSGTDEGLSIDAKGTGSIRLGATSTGAVEFSRSAVPTANDGSALGSTSLSWSDLFLASGGVINFNNGAFTLTQSTSTLTASGTIATADLTVTNTPRINQVPATVGTGAKTISNAADSTTNFGHYLTLNMNGTNYYIPCSAVAPA